MHINTNLSKTHVVPSKTGVYSLCQLIKLKKIESAECFIQTKIADERTVLVLSKISLKRAHTYSQCLTKILLKY